MRCILFFLCFFSVFYGAPPKVVVFDYGGVIAKVNRKPVIDFLSQSLDIPYSKVRKDFASEALYKAFNEPIAFWEKYGGKTLSKDWFEALERHKREIVQPVPGMQELILTIKGQGIQVALLSNTNPYRAQFLESMGGYRHFDPVLLSCYLGVAKPRPEIYKKMLLSVKHDASECFFIDNKEKNIEAAKKLGINGTVFISVDQLKSELRKQQALP